MEGFTLIGKKLTKQTCNTNGQAAIDCGMLWQSFMEEGIMGKIPNKVSNEIVAVYYDYESDEHGMYSFFIGCKVEAGTTTPEGLDELLIPAQTYQIETAQGSMPECVANAWKTIWSTKINRAYGYDFEVYDERSHDWTNATIDIYLSVKG